MPVPIGADNINDLVGRGSDYISGNNNMPLLWMALFTTADLKTVHIPDESVSPGTHILALHATKKSALETFDRRIPAIRRHIDPALWFYVLKFRRAVAECEYNYVEIDFHEMWLQGEESADELEAIIYTNLHFLGSEELLVRRCGHALIGNTADLYGVDWAAGDGFPFGTVIDLPNVEAHLTYRSGRPCRNELPIDDRFVLTYDAAGDTALRFAICFQSVWARIQPQTSAFLLDQWKNNDYVTIPGVSGITGPAQRISSPGRPVLGLLSRSPKALGLSFTIDNGKGMVWSARDVRLMDDNVIVALIAKQIVQTKQQLEMQQDDYWAVAAQNECGVDISPLTKWVRDNPQ